jgi:hypothetical protein
MGDVKVIVGVGAARAVGIRHADVDASNWTLAEKRGLDVSAREQAEGWCVVLPADLCEGEGASDGELDLDPTVVTYERVPDDSPALAAWRRA